MSEKRSPVRISLRLVHFFNDHRQLARIYVNENFKNISDLKLYIKKIFGIKKNFYLLCQNHYLPALQDIRVLNENDLVDVIPIRSTSEDEASDILSPKKRKRKKVDDAVEIIINSDNESNLSKQKCKNKIKDEVVSNEAILHNDNSINYLEIGNKTSVSQNKKDRFRHMNSTNEMEYTDLSYEYSDQSVEAPSKKRKHSISTNTEQDLIIRSFTNIKSKPENEAANRTSNAGALNTFKSPGKNKTLKIKSESTFVENLLLDKPEITKTYRLTDTMDFENLRAKKAEKIENQINLEIADNLRADSLENSEKKLNKNEKKKDRKCKKSESCKLDEMEINTSTDIFADAENNLSQKFEKKNELKKKGIEYLSQSCILPSEIGKEKKKMKRKAKLNVTADNMKNSHLTDLTKFQSWTPIERTKENVQIGSKSELSRINDTQNLDLSDTKFQSWYTDDSHVSEKEETKCEEKKMKKKNLTVTKFQSWTPTEPIKEENVQIESNSELSRINDNTQNLDLSETKFQSWYTEDSHVLEKEETKCEGKKRKKKHKSLVSEVENSDLSKSKFEESYEYEDSFKAQETQNKKTKMINSDSLKCADICNESKIKELSSPLQLESVSVCKHTKNKKDSKLNSVLEDENENENSLLNKNKTLNEKNESKPRADLSTSEVDLSTSQVDLSGSRDIKQNSFNLSKSQIQRLSSVGYLMSQISEEKSGTDFVTKRKRVRQRKRHKKSVEADGKDETISVDSYFQTIQSIAAPKIHKRFSENEYEESSSIEPNPLDINEDLVTHSTPYSLNNKRIAMSIIPEERDDDTCEFIKKINPDSLKKLRTPPNVNEKIIFKKLKLNENYNPVISGYIYGEIKSVSQTKSIVEVKILAGYEELKDPDGRFAFESEGTSEIPSVVELQWSALIELF